jgi:hypothetical protein
MHADELAMANDVECNCNPRSDAGKQKLARRIQRAEALNEQAGMTGLDSGTGTPTLLQRPD